MFRSTVVSYIRLSALMFKINLQSAMEYRASFIMQIISMIISDASFAIIWFIFFKRFPVVNGWQTHDMMILMAMASISIGLYVLFAGGIWDLARKIASGELDHHLMLPQHTLWNVAMGKLLLPGLGDLIFGVVLYFMVSSFAVGPFMLFLLLSFVTAIIIFNFSVITQSLGFYMGNFEDAAEQLWVALYFCISTPQGSFHGALKVILMTVIPGFFIAELPVGLMRNFNLWHLLALVGFTVGTFILAIFVFNRGLRRYESGSLMNVKL